MARIEEIVRSIDGRLAELDQEIRALSDARAALDGGTAARSSRRVPATRPAQRRGTRSRRRSARKPAMATAGIEQLLGESGPSSAAALAKRAGAKRVDMVSELERLERAGRVRRSGSASRVRWQLVTDEERIAARAAELAKPSRRRRGSSAASAAQPT